MPWLPFVLFAIIAFSINGILFRTIMKENTSDPVAQTVGLLGLGGIFVFSLSIILGKFHMPAGSDWLAILAGAAVAAIGSVCMNASYKLIEASEIAIIASSQRLFSVLGAFIFLGELFSPLKLVATFFILAGVAVASWKKHTMRWDKGALFVLGSAMFFSAADILGYYALRTVDTMSFTALGYMLPAIMLLIARPKTFKNLSFYAKKNRFSLLFTAAVLDCAGTFSFLHAYTIGKNASVITPLAGSKIIFTLILGYIILKERDNMKKKIIGAGIILMGSLLLFI